MSIAATPDPHWTGLRIAEARRDRGLTQRDLARVLGVSLHAVDRLETGATDATLHLPGIADATDRPHKWFVEPTPETSAMVSFSHRDATSSTDLGVIGRHLVLGAIVLLVTIRFFTEVIPVLPRAANFIDIPIFLALGVAALMTSRSPSNRNGWYLSLGIPAFLFFGVCVLAVVANSNRVAIAPVLVFIYGFLAPIGVYAAAYRIWPSGNALALSRTIVALGVVQLAVVALIDLPRFVVSRNPDDISGTFGTNAYQLVFFLLMFIALLAGIATVEPGRLVARFAPALIAASFATIFLAQYRSLLVGMVVAMVAIGVLLGGRVRGFVVVGVAVIGFAVAFYYVATKLPALKLHSAASSLASDPNEYVQGRLRVAQSVSRLYEDIPIAIAVGTGPGTYSSRAWQTFANANSTSLSNVAGGYAARFTGGTYSTDVSDKYVLTQIRYGRIVEGSKAVSTPYSSYTSLSAEVGLLGLLLICLVYFGALTRVWRMARSAFSAPVRGDPAPALVLATVIGFLTLVQLALLENWFEVTRATFVAWALLAVATRELEDAG